MSAADPTGPLRARLAALPGRVRAEAVAALGRIGEEMAEAARDALRTRGSPQPRAPGSPPRESGGDLAASLAVEVDAEAARAVVVAASPLARFVEYGTRRMAARPFLRPAAEAVRPAAVEQCRAALARAAREPGDGA